MIKKLLFALIVSVVLTIIFTFPSALNLTKYYIGDGWDNYQYAAYQGIAANQIKSGEFPFHFTNFWRYPTGFDFARGFDFYLSVGLGAVFTLFLGYPLGYNTTILFLMMLNGVFSYLLFRQVTQSKILGLLGMIIYGFSFYNISKASSHPNLLFTGGFALFFFAIYRLINLEKIKIVDYILLFSSVFFIAIGSGQYFLIFLLFLFIYGLVSYLFYKDLFFKKINKIKDSLFSFLLTGIIILLPVFFAYLPHIKAIINGSFIVVKRGDITSELVPSFYDFFLPNSYLRLYITQLLHSPNNPSIEKAVFLGWIELVLFALFFVSKYAKKTKLFIGSLFLIPFIFSSFLPHTFLSQLFPFKLIAETGRYLTIFYLFLTIGGLLYLKSINSKAKYALVVIVIIFVILERVPSGFYLSDTLKNEAFIDVVKKKETKAVLDIPINLYNARYDIFSIYYNKPIVNGYFHWVADGIKEKVFVTQNSLLNRYVCSGDDPILSGELDLQQERLLDIQMISLLKENGISTVVIHKDDKFFHPICRNVRLRLSNLIPAIESLEITSSTSENQLEVKLWDGKPDLTIYFSHDGTFYLDGLYIAPTDPAEFTISPADFSYSWIKQENSNARELDPPFSISTKVKAGSFITISSQEEVASTVFSLWYRYSLNPNSDTKTYVPVFKKVFEDEKAIVFSL